MSDMCECGHTAEQHMPGYGPCISITRISESENGICICQHFKDTDGPVVDPYASDHADMAFMFQEPPPLGRPLSQARRMARALYIYEWAKQNKVMDGEWEVHHSLDCIAEAIREHEAKEH